MERCFIRDYLVCGPYLTDPETQIRHPNQLEFERLVREEIALDREFTPPTDIYAGKPGVGGEIWHHAELGNDNSIDLSVFYHLLKKVEVWAYTRLYSEKAMEVSADVWTYATATVFVNGGCALEGTPARYKPIKRQPLTLKLKAGYNDVFVRLLTLGARDTRTLFALELHTEGVTACLPDPDGAVAESKARWEWLKSVRIADGCLKADGEPPCPVKVNEQEWKSCDTFKTEAGDAYYFLSAEGGLKRRVQAFERCKPGKIGEETDTAARKQRIFAKLSSCDDAFQVYTHFVNGTQEQKDYDALTALTDHVDTHADCSDFVMNGLLRIFKKFEVPEDIRAHFKEVALRYRYWMDENGADAMCFWSENHALLFFSNQYVAGDMFPDETFSCSGLNGRAAKQLGRSKCLAWLTSITRHGFEEFASSGYAPVTSAALMMLYDNGDAELKEKAKYVLDGIWRQLALHSFKRGIFAPQGRVYRPVITPFWQGTQAMLDFALPGMYEGCLSWLGAYAGSDYELPSDLADIAKAPRDLNYRCGNAQIALKKTDKYLLTSCASPKQLAGDWHNDVYGGVGFDYTAVKRLNERFHGTTLIRPGVYGYQQHLMYAALSPECFTFANHPGGACDASVMRPGYWNGNGVMPAIKQKGNTLGVIYNIPDVHPIDFTHVFWPECAFDKTEKRGNWLVGYKDDAAIALYCSLPLEKVNDILTDCELRATGRTAAYVFKCLDAKDVPELDKESPSFDKEALTLTCGKLSLTYKAFTDDTQYV